MQFGRAAAHAMLGIGDDGRAVVGAAFGVAADETVVDEAMKTIMAAGTVQSQQVIAQQRKLLLLAQRPHGALGGRRTDGIIVHFITPLGSPRGGVESLVVAILCAAPFNSSTEIH